MVTGGSRGIGRAVCLELAKGGANVVLCYAGRAEAAQETVTACEDLGAKALAVQCNVADEAQVKALMDAAVKEFGRIDILVNNAGVTRDGLVMMMKEADFDAVIDTNLKGTFLCMKAVSRIMMKQRYGRIVNLSSVVGLRGNAGQVNYAASKAGVVGMTKSLAKELASRGVTVNAVAPGFIETDMTAAMPQAAKDAMMPTIPMQRLGAAGGCGKGRGLPGQPAAQHLRLRQPPGLPRQYVRRPAVRPGLLEDQESARDPGGRGVRHRHHRRPAVLSCGGGLYGRSGRLHRLLRLCGALPGLHRGRLHSGRHPGIHPPEERRPQIHAGRIGALIPTEKGSFHA